MKRQRPQSNKFKPRKRRAITAFKAPATYQPRGRIVRPEYKCTDTSWAAVGVYSNGAPIDLIANLTRGTGGIDNFDGNKVFPVGLEIRGSITSNESVQRISTPVRIVIFQWFDATPPTSATLLQSNSTTKAVYSPKNLTNRDNVCILWDKLVPLNRQVIDATYAGTVVYTFKKYFTGKRMSEIAYGVASGVQKGGLWIAAFSTVTSGGPIFDGYSRMTFTE